VQLAAKLGLKIDVNQATTDDWLRLPGLSIHQARALAQLTRSGVHFYGLEDIAAALGLSPQSLAHLAPVLAFCYYDPGETLAIQPVHVNTASIAQLTRIPAIDLFLARTIVQTRQTQGAYRNLADLQQRLTLPPALVSELLHYLRF
jgi:DNA uptake protein ComE-like DNA-binding protein